MAFVHARHGLAGLFCVSGGMAGKPLKRKQDFLFCVSNGHLIAIGTKDHTEVKRALNIPSPAVPIPGCLGVNNLEGGSWLWSSFTTRPRTSIPAALMPFVVSD